MEDKYGPGMYIFGGLDDEFNVHKPFKGAKALGGLRALIGLTRESAQMLSELTGHRGARQRAAFPAASLRMYTYFGSRLNRGAKNVNSLLAPSHVADQLLTPYPIANYGPPPSPPMDPTRWFILTRLRL